jgi:hypothetical protein
LIETKRTSGFGESFRERERDRERVLERDGKERVRLIQGRWRRV